MTSFEQFSMSPGILDTMKKMGYEKPSDIQVATWSILLNEKTDFMGLAATGTGKTAAFAVPMLEQIDPSLKTIQALILCPTRELAMQVAGQVTLLGKSKGAEALTIYGGASYQEQFRGIKRGLPVVVGTPGRLVDHIKQGSINLENVKHIILDEADEMISMGFKEDLETILSAAKKEDAQIWLFSATMGKEVRRVADQYLRSPKQAEVNRTEKLPEKITQQYFVSRDSNKAEILCKIIDMAENFYGIIFCQTKALVSDLTQYLSERGYRVDSLHGDKDQKSRERTMQSFRDHKVQILVCTDVASRGLDVKDITHVINFSIPRELESYVHRIGRTARSGKEGFAFSLVSPAQFRLLDRLERMTKSRITEGKIPTRKDVTAKKLALFLPVFQNVNAAARALEVIDDSWKTALEKMTKEEIAARFLALANPGLFTEDTRPNMPGPQRREDGDSRGGERSYGGGRRDDRGGRGESRGRDRNAGGDRGGYDRRSSGGGERSYGGPRRDDRGSASTGRSFDRRDDRREQTDKPSYVRKSARPESSAPSASATKAGGSGEEAQFRLPGERKERGRFEKLGDFVKGPRSSSRKTEGGPSSEGGFKKPHPGVRFSRPPRRKESEDRY